MVARLANIENGIVVCRLSGTGQHRCCAALQFADFLCNTVVGRICQTAVKISGFLQIKKSAHLLRGFIFKRRTLINREHSRLSVLRLPARLYTDRFLCVCHSILLPLCLSGKIRSFVRFILRPSCDILPERRHPRPADPGYAAVPLMQSRLLP